MFHHIWEVMRTLPIQDNFSPLIKPLEGPNSACRKKQLHEETLGKALERAFPWNLAAAQGKNGRIQSNSTEVHWCIGALVCGADNSTR